MKRNKIFTTKQEAELVKLSKELAREALGEWDRGAYECP